MHTTFRYDHYCRYAEMKKRILYFAEKYPHLCTVETLCTTPEKRSVFAVTLTSQKTGPALSKPALYIEGNTHAGEVTGSMAALRVLDTLVSSCEEDPSVQKLLDTHTVYILPRISPDGAETYLSTPRHLRSVDRVYQEEHGGIAEQDMDQDGVIRMMRIVSPFGAWKKDPENPDVMIQRLPDDTEGTFYDIYPEGTPENKDNIPLKVKKSEWGLDFNRNYPFEWYPDARQPGAGKYPLSNPETRAVADFVLSHPNIGLAVANHTSGGILLFPPGTRSASKADPDDIQAFREIGEMCRQETGYQAVNIFDSYIQSQTSFDSGAFDDWCYQTQGIPAYTLELWDLDTRAGAPVDWAHQTQESMTVQIDRFQKEMAWVRKNAPEQYLDWTPFQHPVLGPVEIGGFNIKYTLQNPPKAFLNQETEKVSRFLIRCLKTLPHLQILPLTVRKISRSVYEIRAVIQNTGYLPTCLSDQAGTLKASRPVKVRISTDTEHLISGKPEEEIGDLSGYSRSRYSFDGNVTAKNTAAKQKEAVWVIKAEKGASVTVTAVQEKSGQSSVTVIV